MAITKLALEYYQGNDCKLLRLIDSSYYNPAIDVENAILEITVPGYDCPVLFSTTENFNTVFNSSDLKVNKALSASELISLPDGIYRIKYSIKPNSVLSVEYSLMRNCQLVRRYISAICKLFDIKCTISKAEFEKRRRELIWIKELIDASVYKVEDCNNEAQGLELYNEANSLLTNYSKCPSC